MDRDMLWRWDEVLKTHPNGMRFMVFGEEGDLLATNEYFRFVLRELIYHMFYLFEMWYLVWEVGLL